MGKANFRSLKDLGDCREVLKVLRLFKELIKGKTMKRTYITLLLAAVAMCTFADAPNGSGTYYQNANGYKGAALKTALRGIIYNRTELDYNDLWGAFYTTDVRSDGKVWDMYSNITNFEFGTDQAGNYSKEGDVYNREHSFPASWFGDNTPMYTDLHHIYPTDGYVNNKRSNYPFGETTGNKYKSANDFSKLGNCTYSGYTGIVFEPADEYKGDFARTYFYMVTCYEEKLADWYSKNSESRATIDGSTYPAFQTWQLNMLLKWAKNDPVSEKEVNRNNEVKRLQGNRNPFIDYPGLEQYIWDSKKTDAFSYDNYVQPTIWSTEYNSSGSGGDDPGPSGLVTDVIDRAFTGVTDGASSYVAWSGKNGSASSAVYAGQSAGSHNSVQLRSKGSESGIISTTSGGKLTKVSVTWNSNTISGRTLNVYGKNTAYTAVTDLYNSSTQGTLLGTIVNGTSTELTISGNFEYIGLRAASDAMFFDKIEITWDSGSSLEASDLTLSASSLSFDLYNDGGAKTVSYTTSSTGAVTVSESEYVTTSVSGNTITVTPVKVTPSAQTITVSQVADATYEAGSVTFTVTVGDSTPVGPTPSGKWVEIPFADLTASDVFVIVGNNGNNYALPNDVTGSAPVATSVTVTDGKITSPVADNLKWNITSKAKGYMFCPNGSTTTWLYCTDSDNGLRVGDNVFNNVFVMGEGGYLQNVGTSRYVGIYNSQDWRCYTSTDVNIGGQTFKFYKYQVSIPVTVSELGCGTFASDYALDFSNSEIRAFYAMVSGDNLIFHEVEKVPANTGVLLYKVGGASDDIPVYNGTTDAVTGNANAFVRGTGAAVSYTDDDKNYILFDGDDGLGFYKAKNNTVATNRAYIHVPVSVNVKCFLLDLENDPTGIESIQNSKFKIQNEDAIYNLAGQRLSKMQKGINIVNGKKVLR